MHEKPRDDLKLLDGIGKAWETRLKSIGVHTFQNLADLSSAEIGARLKAEGQPVPPQANLNSWISQAKELIATDQASSPPEVETNKINEISNPPTGSGLWKKLGIFVVEYEYLEIEGEGKSEQIQVRVNANQNETDSRHSWDEFGTAEPCQWMLEQIQIGEIASVELKQLIKESRIQTREELEREIAEKRAEAYKILDQENKKAQESLKQELDKKRIHSTQDLLRSIEERRVKAQEVLEQEIVEKSAADTQELNSRLIKAQIKAEKDLKQELEIKRSLAEEVLKKQLDAERAQAGQELKQELAEKRTTATQALENQLDTERAQAEKELEQELADKQTAATQALENQLNAERAQAQEALEQELADKRTAAAQEVENQLETERAQAQEGLEQELFEMRTQVMFELERKIKEGRLLPPQDFKLQDEEEEEEEPQPQPEPVLEEKWQPAAQLPEPEPLDLPFINLAITQLQIFQPLGAVHPIVTSRPDITLTGRLSSSEGFSITVDFNLAAPPLSEIVDLGMTYYIQLFAQNIAVGSKFHLGNSKAAKFIEDQSRYNVTFGDLTLADGTYDLSAFVVIQDGRQIADYLKVPLIQVV